MPSVEAASRGVGLPPEICQVLDDLPEMIYYATPIRDGNGAVVDFRHVWANTIGTTGTRYPLGTLLSALDEHIEGVDLVDDCRGVLETGEPLLGRRTVSRAPGSVRGLPERHFDMTVVRFGAGLLLSGREVTDQLLAEQAAAAGRRMYESTFTAAPVAMAILDLRPGHQGEYLAVNDEHLRLTGHTREELMAGGWSSCTHPDDLAENTGLLRQLVAGRLPTPVHVYTRMVTAGGTEVPVKVGLNLVTHDDDGLRAIAYVEDLTARRNAESEVTRLATHDLVTDLPNRAALMAHLHDVIDQVVVSGAPAGLIHAGMDHFTSINDGFSRDVGDQALRTVGEQLRAALPADCLVSRIAGDEFAVVAPDLADEEALARVAGTVLAVTARPVRLVGRETTLSASVGATLLRGRLDPEQAVLQAETAMQLAKRRGRHRVELYTPGQEHVSQRRLIIEDKLRSALEHGWFRLHYQPMVDLTGDELRIVGAEALLRLEHPERGLLPPANFIDVAEDSNLIVPIGAWVAQEACEQLATWQQLRQMEMAINVSGRQVARAGISTLLLGTIRDAGLDPHTVCLEMTERVLIEADDVVATELQVLADAGTAVAIDDFGTGYSSLSYLQRFPVSTVKIDRSFVAALGRSTKDTAIVDAVLALGSALDLTVVAEGVEEQRQLDHLRRLGCPRAQGYLLGRPMPAEEFTALLNQEESAARPSGPA